jgi:hypothetical protein
LLSHLSAEWFVKNFALQNKERKWSEILQLSAHLLFMREGLAVVERFASAGVKQKNIPVIHLVPGTVVQLY